MVRVCVVSLREEDKGMGVGMGGGAWQNYRTQYSPPPKKKRTLTASRVTQSGDG